MTTQNTGALSALSDALADLIDAWRGRLVTVHGRGHRGSTGLAWSDDLVLTADHTIERDEDILVTLPDGSTSAGTLVGRDPSTDLALLRVSGAAFERPPLATATLRPGHLVLALGRGRSGVGASLGVVRAVGGPWRSSAGGQIDRYIDVNGELPRGSSGGPLVDATGALIGLNTAGLVRGGTTVGVVTLERVAASLLKNGRIQKAYLGLSAIPAALPGRLAAVAGATEALLVVGVEADGPADQAGLSLGDVLLTVEGARVSRLGDLLGQLGEDRVGVEITLGVLRAGALSEHKVTLGGRPATGC